MEIKTLKERLKWMLSDLEKAEKSGITDAEIHALFSPNQEKLLYKKPRQPRCKTLELHMDYAQTVTEKKNTIIFKVHEYGIY